MRVFINYRREDAGGFAGLIYRSLASVLGDSNLFMDVKSIGAGEDFATVINDKARSSDVMLVLIGQRWLAIQNARGKRRLDGADDFVRREIEVGLERRTQVIPVLLEGAPMPAAESLPLSIRALAGRNAVSIIRWDTDVDRLADSISAMARGWVGGHWEDLGGMVTAAPAVASPSPDRMHCFVRGTDSGVYHLSFSDGSWSAWSSVGGHIEGSPAAASWETDRVDCFVRGMDNHLWQRSREGDRWSPWKDMGGPITAGPAVVSPSPGRLHCFVRGPENDIFHRVFDGQ